MDKSAETPSVVGSFSMLGMDLAVRGSAPQSVIGLGHHLHRSSMDWLHYNQSFGLLTGMIFSLIPAPGSAPICPTRLGLHSVPPFSFNINSSRPSP